MALLDQETWESKIYLDGWTKGSGGDYEVVEPTTGQVLGRLGLATPDDVARATARAAEAQMAWAAAPYLERAAVLLFAEGLRQGAPPSGLFSLVPDLDGAVGAALARLGPGARVEGTVLGRACDLHLRKHWGRT